MILTFQLLHLVDLLTLNYVFLVLQIYYKHFFIIETSLVEHLFL